MVYLPRVKQYSTENLFDTHSIWWHNSTIDIWTASTEYTEVMRFN